jgi:Tfp pilus assembly protein PilN
VRPVNLLPSKHRPHQPSGKGAGSAYVVVGILGLFLAAAVGYVMQSNKITQGKSDIAVAQQKTAEARARTQQLGPFGNFAQVKEQRVASVRQLAESRFDWERSVRELAHVLPDGVWLRDFDANVGPGAAGAAPTSAGTGESEWAGPSIKLHGCAQKQPQVAVMLVRLREMQGVHDVTLADSTRGEDPDKAQVASGDSAQASDDCGSHNLRGNYEFNVTVEFDQAKPLPADKAAKTPVRLGGGS